MPIFELPEEIVFPHPSYAEEDGLLAVGGDLAPQRILNAYLNGIFPWFSPEDPLLWWSPDPRCVFFPLEMKVSKSLQSLINKNIFDVRFNSCFEEVIKACAVAERSDGAGTWITDEMKEAYINLHHLGWAHSVEVFFKNELAGGLYGLAIGKAFYGESMFHKMSNTSKIALFFLIEELKKKDFLILDNQTTTDHLLGLGAIEVDRKKFLEILSKACTGFEKTSFSDK